MDKTESLQFQVLHLLSAKASLDRRNPNLPLEIIHRCGVFINLFTPGGQLPAAGQAAPAEDVAAESPDEAHGGGSRPRSGGHRVADGLQGVQVLTQGAEPPDDLPSCKPSDNQRFSSGAGGALATSFAPRVYIYIYIHIYICTMFCCVE